MLFLMVSAPSLSRPQQAHTKKERFPDRVKKTQLQPQDPEDAREIAEALGEQHTQEAHHSHSSGIKAHRYHLVSFGEHLSHESGYQIKSPTTRDFKLILQAAEHFEISDSV